MILKKKMDKTTKVVVQIWGSKDRKFASGQRSIVRTVYDTTPEEVLEIVDKALIEAAE